MKARLLLIVGLYATLAYLWHERLKPQPTPADTLMAQRKPRLERLTHFLTKAPSETVQPILMSVALLSDEKLEKVDAWLRRPPLDQLRELTVQDTAMLANSGQLRDALLLGWLGQDHPYAILEAHLMLCAAGDRLGEDLRLHAIQCLAERARLAGDRRTALTLLERAIAFPMADWALVQKYLEAAKVTAPASATVSVLETWLRRHPEAPAAEREAAKNSLNDLLIRAGMAAEALLAEQEALKALPAEAPLPEASLQRALTAARATGVCVSLMPWLQRHLASFPEHQLAPQSLLKNNSEVSPSYRHWLHEAARIADRELPTPQAYELCKRLAALGEPSALARVCQLASSTQQLEDGLSFLHLALTDISLRPALLALSSADSLARRVVHQALHDQPENRDLHYAATLAESAAEPRRAPTLWQTYLRRFPQDHAARRRLVQAHLAAQQPALALRVLDGMEASALTEEDRHQQQMLRQM